MDQEPQVIVPERVLRAILEETLEHPHTETGQALVGLELEDAIFILGTIPDVLDTVRTPGSLRLGGQDQVEIFLWLRSHWEAMRTNSGQDNWKLGQPLSRGEVPKELDRPLRVIGYWHRHPGNYRELSPTDLREVENMLKDPNQRRDQVLAPIITYEPVEQLLTSYLGRDLILRYVADEVRLTWHLFRRDSPEEVEMKPVIVPDNYVPWLPPIAWHLTNVRRMQLERSLLQQSGYRVRWLVKEMNGDPLIQEVVFGIDHPSWHTRILIVTPWDYPKARPTLQLLSKGETPPSPTPPSPPESRWLKFFRRLFGRPIPTSIWDAPEPLQRLPWDRSVYLVDLVRRVENQLRRQDVGQEQTATG